MPSDEAAQVHVRVPSKVKRAIKIFCAREGLTEQGWALQVLTDALGASAPDLVTWRKGARGDERSPAGKSGQRS
jgi:hypothetical protein